MSIRFLEWLNQFSFPAAAVVVVVIVKAAVSGGAQNLLGALPQL